MDRTIASISTNNLGTSAINIVRISGPKAVEIVSSIFSNKNFKDASSHTIHYGWIKEGEETIMAHKISNECIACGGCQSVCPCGAISEGDGKFEIAADLCVDCGACSAQCPVGAIEED